MVSELNKFIRIIKFVKKYRLVKKRFKFESIIWIWLMLQWKLTYFRDILNVIIM